MRVLKRTGDHYASTRGFTLTLPIELFRQLQQIQDRARTARMDMGGVLAAAIEDAADAIEQVRYKSGEAGIFPPGGEAEGRRGKKQWLRFARS